MDLCHSDHCAASTSSSQPLGASIASECARFRTCSHGRPWLLRRDVIPLVESRDVSNGKTAVDLLREVEAAVRADGNDLDLAYLLEHMVRFERTIRRVAELAPEGGRVLDIGSHYLHLSCALAQKGYDVVGMDVSPFAGDDLMQRRAARLGFENRVIDKLEDGDFLAGEEGGFDVVIFTEILEHITFNPILFWRRVCELLKVGGFVYITTPNSLTLWKIMHVIKRLLTLNGVGLTAAEIFHTVTYGHHWKEYSASEVRDYFPELSPNLSVEITHFNYPALTSEHSVRSFKAGVRRAVHGVSAVIPPFRDQLEILVRLNAQTKWSVAPPRFV